MKMVIYRELGVLCCTALENYKARIRNAKQVQRLADFDTPQEIIEYYCKYFGSVPEDFTIID